MPSRHSSNIDLTTARAGLADRIEAYMGSNGCSEDFDTLALAIFDYQIRANVPYANYARQLGGGAIIKPNAWNEIPALPADAFREIGHPPACFPVTEAVASFETSGSTGNATGRHHFSATNLYEQSILAGWHHAGLPEHPVAFLTPSPEQAPQSSLSFMMGVLAKNFGAASDATPYLLTSDGEIDLARLRACGKKSTPILLLGTALAFLHLFELLEDSSLTLPAGSTALETGGYKGTRHSLTKSQLYHLFEKHLGLSATQVHNEYGMTELSSQFYASGIDGRHCGGPWTGVSIIDPETGKPAAPGTVGTITITDLANLESCIRIATRDLGRRDDPEDVGFTLLGRDPAAIARGCSRAADEILSSASEEAQT